MNSLINYLLEAHLCLLIFGLFYLLILRNENNFKFLRYYILFSALLSAVIPTLHFSNIFEAEIPMVSGIQTLILPEIVIGGGVQNAAQDGFSKFGLFNFIVPLYLLGMVILMTIFLYQLFQIYRFRAIKKNRVKTHVHYELIPTDGHLPTFSFLNMLFYDNTAPLSEEEKQKIIDHEVFHIRDRHSLDIIFLELVKISFWINPFSWWMKHNMQNVHEYLADQKILKNTDRQVYSSLLAKMALKQLSLPIGHHFNKSMTLKRIKMMKTAKTKLQTWKLVSLIPMIMLLLLVFSCNEDVMQEVEQTMVTTSQSIVPDELLPDLKKLEQKYPDAEFIYMETDVNNEDQLEKLKGVDPNSIGFMKVYKERERIGMIINKNGALKKYIDQKNQQGEVFTIVEDPAAPIGGYDALYEQIASKLKYPEQARKMGIEGTVYVQFIVQEDGVLSDVEVVRGIGAGCDQVAKEVIEGLEPFKPALQRGQPVKQKIVLPLKFTLNNTNSVPLEKPQTIEKEMLISATRTGTTVQGQIKSPEGKALAGVNVVQEGTTIGTVTNLEGNFKMNISDPSAVLVFSFIGFKTNKIPVESL